MPPESFIFLDHKGLIQDANNVPILYHIKREAYEKTITCPWHISYGDPRVKWMYDVTISDKDRKDDYKKDKSKYWWLASH